ncbi:hypothetical protein ILUMI_00708 [Ignelater luminosus]|uniref:Ion transport domain-containing protein n=1 Tax=Ignelater luminosus TaxID=2038154 RepID=A0A8K0DFR7_IGNLU|nr:hypothetical protein ILUMI_00708 [Ignelater luminosus]
MSYKTFQLEITDISQQPELQLLDYVRTNQAVHKVRRFIIDNPETLTKVIGHPFNKPVLYIACNELAHAVTPEIVETLVKAGANLYYSDELHNYKQALHFAALGGNSQILQVIIRRLKLGKINSLSNGNTALNLLIKEGDSRNPDFNVCIKLLIQANIDINKPDDRNLTPIFWAAKKGYRDVVQIILHESKQKIDIESHKLRGKSAKDYIVENGFEDVLKNLPLKSGNNNKTSNSSNELFNFLKEYDEDGFINCKYLADFVNSDDGVYTLLQFATKKGLSRAVESLLSKGADPNQTTAKTKTSTIEIAAKECNHEILGLLLRHQNINIPSHILIDVIRRDNHNFCYSLLMKHKSKLNINITDDYGHTALYFTVLYGDSKKTLDLLRAGASMACKTAYGKLPIVHIDANTLETHLDECLEANLEDNIYDELFPAVYNYRTLMPSREIRNEYRRSKHVQNVQDSTQQLTSETQVILCISKSTELKHLLKHPVITSFLYIKWHRIRWFFYTNLAFFIAFCLSLILYILIVYNSQEKDDYQNTDRLLLGGLCVTFILLVVRELFQIVVIRKAYFYSFENLLEIALIFLTAVIIFKKTPTQALRKQISAFAILSAAFELVLLIGQHPEMSTNIVMLRRVSFNFFKFLMWYSVLIVAFALSFHTLFKDVDDENHFFASPATSLFKTIIMLTGEFEAQDIHFEVYPVTSHIIFMLFVFMIAIILFNLLQGLAVSDTQLLKSDSELIGHITRVEHIAFIESVFLGHILPNRVIGVIGRYTSRFCITQFVMKSVFLFPHLSADYSITIYPNVHLVTLQEEDCSGGNIAIRYTTFCLNKQTAKRTKQLIKRKKEILGQKRKEQNIIEMQKRVIGMQELLRKEQQIILNKLDCIITNIKT